MNDAELQHWCERAVALGADAAVPLEPSGIVTSEWVRMKCLFGCDGPGECRTCPPASPTPRDTRRLLDEFRKAILLRVGPFRGTSDDDERGRRLNDAAVALEREILLAGHHKAWTMGAGPCDICDTCDMSKPCVDPERARPAMEACGVDVFTTVRNAGWQIEVVRDKEDEYRFFALVLVE